MILMYKHNHGGLSGDKWARSRGFNPWILITGWGGKWDSYWFGLVQNLANQKNHRYSGPSCIGYGSW